MTTSSVTASLVNLLRKLSGQENTYTIPKLYVELTKCHVRALILNQLVFFSDKSTRHTDDWFDKTYEDWEKETHVKERTLRNIFKEFKEKNWCESKTIKINGKRSLTCRPLLNNILADIQHLLDSETGKICRIANRKNLPESQPEKFAVSLYTDKTTDKTTDNILSSTKDTQKKYKASDYEKDVRFMRFYNNYPIKKKGAHAYKMWLRLNPSDETLERMLNDIQTRLTQDSNWLDGYIPHPGTYLNPECPVYKDEIFNREKIKHEAKKAKDTQRQEADKKAAEERALASQRAADLERENNRLKQTDGKIFKQITNSPQKITPRLADMLKEKNKNALASS
jgi:ubiquitin